MKLVADRRIPFLQGVFEPYADIRYVEGGAIGRSDVADADALLVRTRTRCDAALLDGSPVRLIASATIGLDHVDLPWCQARGIRVENAAGCNARGVADYVCSALYAVASRRGLPLQGATVGVVGVGHVGSCVCEMLRKLGFRVLCCDPPRALREGPEGFCDLDTLLAASQVVTLHVPLDETTRGMADEAFFARVQPGCIFINAARGEVVQEQALLRARPKLGALIVDTWCNEPSINPTLLDVCDIATPHIAGYSYQGKCNATSLAVRSVARFFGLDALLDFAPQGEPERQRAQVLSLSGMTQGEVAATLQYNYPVFIDDFLLRTAPDDFERIRSEYQYRREFILA